MTNSSFAETKHEGQFKRISCTVLKILRLVLLCDLFFNRHLVHISELLCMYKKAAWKKCKWPIPPLGRLLGLIKRKGYAFPHSTLDKMWKHNERKYKQSFHCFLSAARYEVYYWLQPLTKSVKGTAQRWNVIICVVYLFKPVW